MDFTLNLFKTPIIFENIFKQSEKLPLLEVQNELVSHEEYNSGFRSQGHNMKHW